MSDQQKEGLSALFDGETTEFETRRLIAELDDSDRQAWQRYQLTSDAASNSLGDSVLSINVVDSVAAAIADEPCPELKESPELQQAKVKSQTVSQSWFKPFVGFAAAASIAFIAVINLPAMQSGGQIEQAGFVANGNVSASQLQISGGVGLSQASGVSSVSLAREISDIDAQKNRENTKLNYYLQQHAQHAAFNNGRGLLPLARITKEEY